MRSRCVHLRVQAAGTTLLRCWLVAAVVVLTMAGCDRAAREPLRVLAAQSLVDAFGAMETAFEQAHPTIAVELSTASSGQLRAQIEAGAPADVFASASQRHMDLLAEQELIIADSRRDFAGNRLALVAPSGSALAGLDALKDARIQHVAIGDWSHVPAGRYAKEVLDRHGLTKALEPKLRRCQHVRQVLAYVATGEVEAGFVFGTDAGREPERVEVVWTAPAGDHTPIRLPLAVLRKSDRSEDARRFVAFVLSDAGQRILEQHGFVVPAPAADPP
ncbi:MAG: molybdate ABC transporter substrate-binding protein [Deltaproteobacteria bacterium]|jgi:molybdate transport system substrate-binding protein|nr:molybdate ABC transporter substrate-binding protein [Deltaproteobacteria bacterium]MBW2534005.1 molybdate ABC transporter substrate-binding protein [Deltaproteobacteria bacterium]